MDTGGAEQLVIDFARYIDKKKYEPMVCCLTKGGQGVEKLKSLGIPVFVLYKKSKIDFPILFKLIALIRREKISIVHTHMFTSNMWGRVVAILCRVPVIISQEHAIDYWKNKLHIFIDYFLSFFTDKIIVVSQAVGLFIKNEGVNPEKIAVIYNGIDLDRFNIEIDIHQKKRELGLNVDLPVVGTVGRLCKEKGYEYFLQAAAEILKKKFDTQFLIVGDGELKKELEDYAFILGINRNLIFVGECNAISEIVKTLDVFLLSSIYEGFGIVVLEAFACGVPVVATNVGGVGEVITDGIDGFLVPSKDIRKMAEKVIFLLENPEKAREMGIAGQKKTRKNFGISLTVKKIEDLYDFCLKKIK